MNELKRWMGLAAAADEAETRGDWEAALAILTAHAIGPDGEPFWRPWRIKRLLEIAEVGANPPRWVTSRWVLEQSQQHMQGNRERTSRALEIAVELRGGMHALPGVDHIDARCRVMDHDWVYRQLFLYDFGGLEHFVRRGATADLLSGADDLRTWAATPMGGYRLVQETPSAVRWEDLASGEHLDLLNLGTQIPRAAGDCVIGRVVASGQHQLFEGVALHVPKPVATQVATDPGDWLGAVRAGRVSMPKLHLHGLLSDNPDSAQVTGY